MKMLSVLINGQKAYGKEYSVKDTFAYYELKLKRFSAQQVMHALDKYTDKRNDIPAPADIINILSPEEPKITEAQYVNACKTQERDGWPMYSVAQFTIEDYRRQNDKKREEFKIENEEIARLVNNSVRRIGREEI